MGFLDDSDTEEEGTAGAALEQGFFGTAVLPADYKAKNLKMTVGLVDCKPGETMEFILDSPGEPARRKVGSRVVNEPVTWKGVAIGCVESLAADRLDVSKSLLRKLYLTTAQPIEVPIEIINRAPQMASIPIEGLETIPLAQRRSSVQAVPLPGPQVRKGLAMARREAVNKLMAFQKESARRMEGKEALKGIDLDALARGDIVAPSQAEEDEGEGTTITGSVKRAFGDDARSEGSAGNKRLRGKRSAPLSRSLDFVEDEFGAGRGGGAGKERDTHLYSGVDQDEVLEFDGLIPPGLIITECVPVRLRACTPTCFGRVPPPWAGPLSLAVCLLSGLA